MLIMHGRFDAFLPALDVIWFKYGMNLDHLIARINSTFDRTWMDAVTAV